MTCRVFRLKTQVESTMLCGSSALYQFRQELLPRERIQAIGCEQIVLYRQLKISKLQEQLIACSQALSQAALASFRSAVKLHPSKCRRHSRLCSPSYGRKSRNFFQAKSNQVGLTLRLVCPPELVCSFAFSSCRKPCKTVQGAEGLSLLFHPATREPRSPKVSNLSICTCDFYVAT